MSRKQMVAFGEEQGGGIGNINEDQYFLRSLTNGREKGAIS